MDAYHEKKNNGAKSKKRGRQSAAAEDTPTNGSAKRGRKSAHPSEASPVDKSSKGTQFKPPSGSWEDSVVAIDACEGSDGQVMVYLTWQGGAKSQHPLVQVYKRCPQKVCCIPMLSRPYIPTIHRCSNSTNPTCMLIPARSTR